MAPNVQMGRSRIPELLAKRGKTQVELAEYLEVTESYISQVIATKSKLSVIKMKQTALYLRCKMDDLNEWIVNGKVERSGE